MRSSDATRTKVRPSLENPVAQLAGRLAVGDRVLVVGIVGRREQPLDLLDALSGRLWIDVRCGSVPGDGLGLAEPAVRLRIDRQLGRRLEVVAKRRELVLEGVLGIGHVRADGLERRDRYPRMNSGARDRREGGDNVDVDSG